VLSKVGVRYVVKSCLLRSRFKDLHMSIKVKPTTFLNAVCDPTSHRLVLLTHDVAYGLAISELRFVGLLNEAAKGGCGLLALPRLVRLTHHKDRDKSRNRVSEFACCTRLLNSHEPNIGSFQSCLRNGVYRTDRQLAAAYPEDEMERLFDCKPESYLHHKKLLHAYLLPQDAYYKRSVYTR